MICWITGARLRTFQDGVTDARPGESLVNSRFYSVFNFTLTKFRQPGLFFPGTQQSGLISNFSTLFDSFTLL